MYKLIKKALIPYSIGNRSLEIQKELHANSWNRDLHYKIVADGVPYSARFIADNRSPNSVFGDITNDILYEQTTFCRFLVNNGIPFMRLVPISHDVPFTTIEWGSEIYRFILFEWIEGQHITHCDKFIAEEFGKMAREIHDISSLYNSSVFPKKSHLDGYSQFAKELRNKGNTATISKDNLNLIQRYVEEAEHHIENSMTNEYDFIVQSDLNPLNVIWDENKRVIGIVDFESIGYSDRIEGLAWLIKWYSRTDGIHSAEFSPSAANAFLKGYRGEHFLDRHDLGRLSSLLWLSGCLNWNFVRKTIEIIDADNREKLKEHIVAYEERGRRLLSVVSTSSMSR
ncbi:phosphotransferase enzyme family protein [Rossellomorea aquimaris]|uniref:phosphotransferase enzyme family protein n=1 Tax=Rossellomorea aquimaris TaxID=189382 RepID=UPI0011E8E0F6|nr:phosphotransferase [Rossellomorea aquimaris]TYS89858.1 aminoglycoside phosphotransferase family protein [Rossellomorea aquimaris]